MPLSSKRPNALLRLHVGHQVVTAPRRALRLSTQSGRLAIIYPFPCLPLLLPLPQQPVHGDGQFLGRVDAEGGGYFIEALSRQSHDLSLAGIEQHGHTLKLALRPWRNAEGHSHRLDC